MIRTTSNSRNMSVETFRLFAMLFVIIPHLTYPDLPRDLVSDARLLTRWILPFFYVVSGYFFAEKSFRTGRVDAAPALDRLAWIFITWNLINIPVFFAESNLSAPDFLKMIASPSFIFLGYSSHLWFISSLFFGYLFVAFCYRNNATLLLALASVVTIVLVLYAGSYYVLFDAGFNLVFNMPRHWLSVPFLYLGFLFFQKGRPNWQLSVVLIVFGAALQFVEAKFLGVYYGSSAYAHQFLIGSIPFGVGVAGLALCDLKYLQHPTLGKWGSEYSLGIYVAHPVMGYFASLFAGSFFPALISNPIWQAALPFILFIFSLLTMIALQRYLPAAFNLLLGKRTRAKELGAT